MVAADGPCGHFFIVRHGERTDYVDYDWPRNGPKVADLNLGLVPYDAPLTAEGCRQARALAERLKDEGIRHIYSSPFLRTIQTSHPTAEVSNATVKIETGVQEFLGKDFPTRPQLVSQLVPSEDLVAKFVQVDPNFSARVAASHPESFSGMQARTAHIAKILAEEHCIGAGESILVVGHGASCKAIIEALLGATIDEEPDYCALSKLVYDRAAAKWRLEYLYDCSHWRQQPPLSN